MWESMYMRTFVKTKKFVDKTVDFIYLKKKLRYYEGIQYFSICRFVKSFLIKNDLNFI